MTGGDADHARVEFTTPDREHERRFLAGYVADAARRLPDDPDCERFTYVRAGHSTAVDGGLVIVDLYGRPEAVIDRERDRWDRLVAAGPLTDWSIADVDVPARLAETMGPDRAESFEDYRFLASRASPALFEDRDGRPPPADVPTDTDPEADGPTPVGWITVLHILSNQQGYDLDEELRAYLAGARVNLRNLAREHDPETAVDRIDEAVASLETLRAEVTAPDFGRDDEEDLRDSDPADADDANDADADSPDDPD